MTLLLDTRPPAPIASVPTPRPVAWVLYTPTDKRQGLDAALLDSVSDHTARYGTPTAVLVHPDNYGVLATTARAAKLVVCTAGPGGVVVQAGTWGLA